MRSPWTPGGAGSGSSCYTIFAGKVARELLSPSLSVLPNLLSWSGGKLQASLREKGVVFQATGSDVSELQGEVALCGTKMP